MIYLKTIQVVSQTYKGAKVLNKDFFITCDSVNLFVGNQGVGKSTMLELLQKNHTDLKLELTENTLKNGVESFYFNTEYDNPRTSDPNKFANAKGESVGIGYGGALASRFQSHGEVIEQFIIPPIQKAKDCVILLDEPESGLSITNQFKLIKEIKKALKRGCQFFIATHCYPLIKEFSVISLEHNKQMSGTEFLNLVM